MMWWRQSGLRTIIGADCTPHHIQIIVDGLIYYGRASLFGIGCRRLTLIQLVQSAIPLTLLALFTASAVGPRGLRQRRQGRLLPKSHRLVSTTRLRYLTKFDPRTCCRANGIVVLVHICYVNSKLVRKICKTALQMLAPIGSPLHLPIHLLLRALLKHRIIRIKLANGKLLATYLAHLS